VTSGCCGPGRREKRLLARRASGKTIFAVRQRPRDTPCKTVLGYYDRANRSFFNFGFCVFSFFSFFLVRAVYETYALRKPRRNVCASWRTRTLPGNSPRAKIKTFSLSSPGGRDTFKRNAIILFLSFHACSRRKTSAFTHIARRTLPARPSILEWRARDLVVCPVWAVGKTDTCNKKKKSYEIYRVFTHTYTKYTIYLFRVQTHYK